MLSLSKEVRSSIEKAVELSKDYNNVVSDDMIIMAFLTEEGSLARTVLEDHGVTLEKVKNEVDEMKKDKPFSKYQYNEVVEKEGELTPKTVKVIEASDEIARIMNDSEIGTHHVLISILMHETIGHKVISNLTDDNKLMMNMLMDLGIDLGHDMFKSKTSIKVTELPKYATDLCKEAREGRLDPLIGRQEELDRITQILCRKTKNNPVLLGESGTGKTVIIEGLAQRIVSGDVPVKLRDKQIWSLNVGALLAGAKYRGEFEERIQKIMKEISANPGRIILFVDETHQVMGCGSSGDSNMDMSNMIKPALARGEMQMIGATTIKEYRQAIEPDAAFARRLQVVNIEEPSKEDTIEILKGIRDVYQKFHKVIISDEMIEKMVDLSVRYITDRHLPDKAIDLMDEASAKVNIFSSKSAFEKAIKEKEARKQQLLLEEKYDELLEVDAEIIRLAEENKDGKLMIDDNILANIIEMWTKVPVDKVLADEAQDLLHLEDTMRERVVGQEEALLKVADAIRMSRAGLNDPTKPLGSFLFVGPSGVGKTEVAKTIAEIQFGSEDNMIRLDMAEFREAHTISKLIGSPAGLTI